MEGVFIFSPYLFVTVRDIFNNRRCGSIEFSFFCFFWISLRLFILLLLVQTLPFRRYTLMSGDGRARKTIIKVYWHSYPDQPRVEDGYLSASLQRDGNGSRSDPARLEQSSFPSQSNSLLCLYQPMLYRHNHLRCYPVCRRQIRSNISATLGTGYICAYIHGHCWHPSHNTYIRPSLSIHHGRVCFYWSIQHVLPSVHRHELPNCFLARKAGLEISRMLLHRWLLCIITSPFPYPTLCQERRVWTQHVYGLLLVHWNFWLNHVYVVDVNDLSLGVHQHHIFGNCSRICFNQNRCGGAKDQPTACLFKSSKFQKEVPFYLAVLPAKRVNATVWQVFAKKDVVFSEDCFACHLVSNR